MQQKIEQLQSAVNTLETRLHGLADNVPGMIYQFSLNPDGTMSVRYVSSGCQQIYEVEAQKIQQQAEVIFSMLHPDDEAQFQQTIFKSAQTLQKWEQQWRITTPSGKEKWLQGFSQPQLQEDNSILWYGCIIDITQRKQVEVELAQINDKLHENIQEKTSQLKASQERLQRLADKVPGMLYEYRLDPTGVASLPYDTSLPSIECYPGQLNQVFMNILVNSINALEDRIKNNNSFNFKITINTKLIESNFIRISIADNGSGIPTSIQNKLFDPFFTTKEVGKGTGLGLSISYQIVVEKHRGKLYCYSQPGKGTEFIIEIPVFQ
ncbi:MAG: ATP-binding protein [Rivularia sp. (in: cyanobacteria)]